MNADTARRQKIWTLLMRAQAGVCNMCCLSMRVLIVVQQLPLRLRLLLLLLAAAVDLPYQAQPAFPAATRRDATRRTLFHSGRTSRNRHWERTCRDFGIMKASQYNTTQLTSSLKKKLCLLYATSERT